jgi:hypothetical protein
MLEKNPLGLHRVWRISKDYGSSKDAIESITSHENKVRWQIHRIYRARNNLVHAGSVPSYLEGVVVNAFEYYRSSIATIVGLARKEPLSSDIDQVVAEVGFIYDIYKAGIKKINDKATYDRDLVLKIV